MEIKSNLNESTLLKRVLQIVLHLNCFAICKSELYLTPGEGKFCPELNPRRNSIISI